MEHGSGEYRERFDYAKFNIECEADLVQGWYDAWVLARDSFTAGAAVPGGEKFRIIRSRPGELHLLAFEAWGEMTGLIHHLPFAPWADYAERLDVRTGTPIQEGAIETLHKLVSQHGKGNRNVTAYSSRQRERRDGRSAGGHGIAIGSHKSEFRVSVYKRGNEPGAIEYQFRGDRLHRSIHAARLMERNSRGGEVRNLWEHVRLLLGSAGYVEMVQVTGLQGEVIDAVLDGSFVQDTPVEEQLREIEAAMDRLPPDAKGALFQTLQLQLFGEESGEETTPRRKRQ